MRLNDVKISLDEKSDNYEKIAVETAGISLNAVQNCVLLRKAVDARNKNNVHFVCSFEITKKGENIEDRSNLEVPFCHKPDIRPVVVGSGPAGMFAGLILAEAGLCPIILERGKMISERQKDVNAFWRFGKLNKNSNVQFGEGGAGTFSDGKLMSGIKKDIFTEKVMLEFVKAGAPKEILYLAKPHIGTDNLAIVVQNIRKKIISLGGEYRFENRLDNLRIKDNKIVALNLKIADIDDNTLSAENVILAIGHSSRDTFEMLVKNNVYIEQKAFSIGARIEHKQELINKSQYGKFAHHSQLGAADYKLFCHLGNGRSAYTFCMCPGGSVVAASSEENCLVTNGMSEFARDKENANSALLVGVDPKDFGSDNPLAGMYFQRRIEEQAFVVGGRNYRAPAQLVGDFLNNKTSFEKRDVSPSYSCGVTYCNLNEVLPTYITDTMRYAILDFDKKLKGFASYGAIITAPETRSSSPIRIKRNENFESSVQGLYPCGEGAGYAGGILSSAVDGIKVALQVIKKYE